jgi:hypothetical protein
MRPTSESTPERYSNNLAMETRKDVLYYMFWDHVPCKRKIKMRIDPNF